MFLTCWWDETTFAKDSATCRDCQLWKYCLQGWQIWCRLWQQREETGGDSACGPRNQGPAELDTAAPAAPAPHLATGQGRMRTVHYDEQCRCLWTHRISLQSLLHSSRTHTILYQVCIILHLLIGFISFYHPLQHLSPPLRTYCLSTRWLQETPTLATRLGHFEESQGHSGSESGLDHVG